MRRQANKISKSLFIIPFFVMTLLWILASSSNQKEKSITTFHNQKLPDKIDFNFHIKPILSDRCFTCHGPDANTREAGLRFDTKQGAFAVLGENKDHHAIVAEDIENSTLINRIQTESPEDIMPPPEQMD